MVEEPIEALSERELELVELLAQGMTNKEIAQALFISPNTVKVHLRNIYGKLNVSSRTEASMVALRMGWVQLEQEGGIAAEGGPEPADAGAPPAPRTDASPFPVWKQIYLVVAALLVGLGLWLVWPRPAQPSGPFTDRRVATPSWVPGERSRWQALAQMPVPRSRLALAAHDGELYAIGGESAAGVSNAVDVYLAQSDDWVRGPDKPTAVANIGAVAIDGRIYVPGGTLENGQMSDRIEVLDLETSAWSEGSPMPTGVGAYALAAHDGQLYLFGGWDGSAYCAQALRYDPASDAWTTLASMPTARAFAGAGTLEVNGPRIYVVGGYDGQDELDLCEVYDPQTGVWNSCPAMSAPRAGLGTAVIGNALYAIGGGWDSYLVENEYYSPHATDPTQGTWHTLPSPRLQEWRNLGVVASGTMLHAIGGWDGGYLGANHAYRALYRLYLPRTMGQASE
ncbi:MAG: hypothetical protein JXA09_06885 [Anaerolineae bacterium]|nr:hypothetical protein [Anaerolineae bacterium]